MAIFTRTTGDAKGVVHMDAGRLAGNIVAMGLTKSPTCFKVVAFGDLRNELVTGGAVETILRQMAVDSTVVMYQVENDTSGQVSVLVEATGSSAADLQTRLRTNGNVGAASNVWLGNATVVSSGGFKLA